MPSPVGGSRVFHSMPRAVGGVPCVYERALMTDEIDKLRRRIAELEREAALHAAGGSDPRKIALLKAGVEPHKLADAAAAFRPSGNAKQDTWTLDGLTGPVDSLAREWLSTRPWFGGEPEATTAPEDPGPHLQWTALGAV